jgi:hypothetical protein
MLLFCDIRPVMVSKHSELAKRQDRDHYERFASPSSHTAPPPSHRQEMGSSSRRRTAPPPLHQEEASSNDSVAPPPPPTCLVAPPHPPPTRVEESSDDSPSDSSDYNEECPHVKEVSSYELLHFNCLVQLLNVHIYFLDSKDKK